MSTVNDLLADIARRYNPTDPIQPLDIQEQIAVDAAQGAVHNIDDTAPVGASVDLEKLLNRTRDRLTPAQIMRVGQYSLAQNTPLRIPLPREMRQVWIQNSTDLGTSPTNVVVTLTLDGIPAGPGDYVLRVGSERAFDVYAREIYLYQSGSATAIPVNNPGVSGGLVILVSV